MKGTKRAKPKHPLLQARTGKFGSPPLQEQWDRDRNGTWEVGRPSAELHKVPFLAEGTYRQVTAEGKERDSFSFNDIRAGLGLCPARASAPLRRPALHLSMQDVQQVTASSRLVRHVAHGLVQTACRLRVFVPKVREQSLYGYFPWDLNLSFTFPPP